MLKKLILTFLVLVFSLFSQAITFADSIPVEDIFSDINPDYKYLNELQTLYDGGMISPDSEWKFNPRELLNRDEFVWILMEVTCKDCIQPDTALDIINKYENETVFYDINKNNKYFYCIAWASDEGYVSGYHPWTTCDNWTVREWEKPFCPANTIILEEAIAVTLRASWILTNAEADSVRQDIYDGKITEVLSDDVSPKNLDGSVYTFYPDFRKAIEYEVVDVDADWNRTSYNLLEVVDGKLRPKQAISKEAFLRIAFITLKANACHEKIDSNLALQMTIFDEQCNASIENCDLSNIDNPDNIYDFSGEVYTTCEAWISDPEWYIWRFYNQNNWEEIKKYWKYIDNYDFLSPWNWKVFFRVVDQCWNTWEVYNTLTINGDNASYWIWLEVDASVIYWEWPLEVDFTAYVDWWEWPYICSWDYWNGDTWTWITPSYIFEDSWVYEVTTICSDVNWLESTAVTIISVTDWITDLWLWLEVDASVIYWEWPLEVDFTTDIEWGEWPYICTWDYWDSSGWSGTEPTHIFADSWVYEVTTTCSDVNWLESTAVTIISVTDSDLNTDLNVSINAEPFYWEWPLAVDFEWIVSWWVWPYSYSWDFWDGNWGLWEDILNIFKEIWIYETTLIVTDSLWNVWIANVLIHVTWLSIEDIDSDLDWIFDIDDLCPLVVWVIENDWCPILEQICEDNSDCDNWLICSTDNICSVKSLANSCEYSWWDVIFWNIVCNSCPCNYFLDFTSTLRKCDIVFPAITSPDSKTIYSKWNLFEIE